MYDYGLGVPHDYKTAVKWYGLAAEKGNALAQKKVEIIQERIAREKQSSLNPGFRDLKPGLHLSTINKMNVCEGSLKNSWTTCYGLQNLKFLLTFDRSSYLKKLTVDLGPIVQMGRVLDQFSTYVMKGETNIYFKMWNILGKKYKMDFEFSERDRQLFNEKVKDNFYTVYHGGQVALPINREKRGYSRDLWLYLVYRDVKPAQRFLKSTKPKREKKGDF